MTIPIQSQINNPASGVFGTGQIQFFSASGVWYVPPGIGKVRVRMWGAGGCAASYGGGGGGFALKTIYDLSGLTSIPVVVGTLPSGTFGSGGTSSFGSYVSATGGTGASSTGNIGGTGVGGDINTVGGASNGVGGGGSASIFGNGGSGGASNTIGNSASGGAGGGAGGTTIAYPGGSGYLGSGGATQGTYSPPVLPTSGLNSFSIDFIGTGGGGAYTQSGMNGGGAGDGSTGGSGFPAGGATSGGISGQGLVIVEW